MADSAPVALARSEPGSRGSPASCESVLPAGIAAGSPVCPSRMMGRA